MIFKKFFLIGSVLMLASASIYTVKTESKELSLSPEPQNTAPRYALLIGINQYKSQPGGISHLGGTHNDVALMKSLLAEKGFKEIPKVGPSAAAPCGTQAADSGIKTLCSSQATKQAILDGFDNHLTANAKKYWDGKSAIDPAKGPEVVFYYSGHGSKLSDTEPVPGELKEDLRVDEADGVDETLVPHDTDMRGTKDIRDDEFDKRITELRKYTTNIVFMADTCHSGTITRGAGKKGFEREIATAGGGTRNTSSAVSADNLGSGDGYVTLSGSLPTQYSYEDYLDDPVTKKSQRNGLLTYYFVIFVRQNPNASYREIINLVRNATNAAGRDQTPQAEGDIDRGVFGATGPKVKTPIFVQCDVSGADRVCSEQVKRTSSTGAEYAIHIVRLNVGTVVGARVGGPVIVYGPDAKDIDDKLGSGMIVTATKFTAEVEITLVDGKTVVPQNAKAVLVAPSFSDEKRSVAIDTGGTDAGAESMRRLASELKANVYVKPIEANGLLTGLDATRTADPATATPPAWDVAVVRGTYADYKLGRQMAPPKKNTTTPPDSEPGYFITNRDGMPLYNLWVSASDARATAKLTKALEQHIRYENTKILGNEASDLASGLEVKLVKIKQFENGIPCRNILATEEEQGAMAKAPRLKGGDRFYFTVTNNTSKDLLIYILNLGTTGKISLLYPPASGAVETIGAGKTIDTLGANRCRHFFIPPDEAYGSESIKIIATDTEIPANLLTMDSIGIRAATTRGGESPLTKLLRQTAAQTRAEALEVSAGGWATVNIDYEIVAEDKGRGNSEKPTDSSTVQLSRFPTMEARSEVRKREKFSVQISLTEEKVTGDVRLVSVGDGTTKAADGKLNIALPDGPGVNEWEIDVLLSAASGDFTFSGPDTATIKLPRSGDSTTARFSLTAKDFPEAERRSRIFVTFYNKASEMFLARVEREIVIRDANPVSETKPESGTPNADAESPTRAEPDKRAVSAERSSKDTPAAGSLAFSFKDVPPDLTVNIRTKVFPNQAANSQIIITSPHLKNTIRHGAFARPEQLDALLFARFSEFSSLSARDLGVNGEESAGPQTTPAVLRGFGEKLYDDHAPGIFKETFWELRDKLGEKFKSILVITDDPNFPWELLRPRRDASSVSGEFLGLEYAIGRLHAPGGKTIGDSQPQNTVVSGITVIAPKYEGGQALKEVAKEVHFLKSLSLFNLMDGVRESDGKFANLQVLFDKTPSHIIHFAGHGTSRTHSENLPNSTVLLADTTLNSDAWRGLLGRFGANRPFFFFNACEVGRAGNFSGFVEGFAPTVLEAGASGYIGALWSIGDSGAKNFAEKFYATMSEELSKEGSSVSMADLMRKTKSEFLKNGDPTYLAYVFYGDPNLRLAKQATK